jgi:hypothetical protein
MGGEYTSNSFNEYCRNEGIKRQLTAAYTPQQNGVSERKNRTLLNMVRSIMNARNVPKKFWPEAVKWATHVINRSPTLSVKNITPEEAWSGAKPAVQYFRTFGCIAHVHVNDVQRKKLDKRSKICVLLGISDESKAYKLYDPADKKIIVSRDVIFEEDKSWNWDNTQKLVQQENSSDNLGDVDEGPDKEAAIVNNEENDEMDNVSTNEDNVMVEDTSSITYHEAVKFDVWRKAMDAEMESIKGNNTWELTTFPPGHKSIGVKWIYKTKYNERGDIDKHKARLVAKGYT